MKPDCHGDFNTVFPMGDDGLRAVAPDCQACQWVHDCLKTACAAPDGVEMRAARMAESGFGRRQGLGGFLARWSELKALRRSAAEKPPKKRPK
jgi:hypothetical protein